MDTRILIDALRGSEPVRRTPFGPLYSHYLVVDRDAGRVRVWTRHRDETGWPEGNERVYALPPCYRAPRQDEAEELARAIERDAPAEEIESLLLRLQVSDFYADDDYFSFVRDWIEEQLRERTPESIAEELSGIDDYGDHRFVVTCEDALDYVRRIQTSG